MESSSETRRQEEGGGGYWCQSLSLIYDKMAKYFIPTSPQLLFHSQKNLLDRFVKYFPSLPSQGLSNFHFRVKIQNKIFNLKNGEYLNYIDINKEIDQPEKQTDVVKNKTQNTKPTLILMHGFGSGLGMFFGNLYFSCIIHFLS